MTAAGSRRRSVRNKHTSAERSAESVTLLPYHLLRPTMSKPPMANIVRLRMTLPVVLLLVLPVLSHKHHENLTEEQRNAPVDAILWIHMALQAAVWGVLFPVGMVLGITRSRWHVPLQVCRS